MDIVGRLALAAVLALAALPAVSDDRKDAVGMPVMLVRDAWTQQTYLLRDGKKQEVSSGFKNGEFATVKVVNLNTLKWQVIVTLEGASDRSDSVPPALSSAFNLGQEAIPSPAQVKAIATAPSKKGIGQSILSLNCNLAQFRAALASFWTAYDEYQSILRLDDQLALLVDATPDSSANVINALNALKTEAARLIPREGKNADGGAAGIIGSYEKRLEALSAAAVKVEEVLASLGTAGQAAATKADGDVATVLQIGEQKGNWEDEAKKVRDTMQNIRENRDLLQKNAYVAATLYTKIQNATDEYIYPRTVQVLDDRIDCTIDYVAQPAVSGVASLTSPHSYSALEVAESPQTTGEDSKPATTEAPKPPATATASEVVIDNRNPGGVLFRYSTGIAFSGLLDGDYFIKPAGTDNPSTSINESVQHISESRNKDFATDSAVFMHMVPRSVGRWTGKPALTIGLAPGKDRYFAGGSLIWGDDQRLIATIGVAAGKVTRLKGGYNVGDPYTETDAPTSDGFRTGLFGAASFKF